MNGYAGGCMFQEYGLNRIEIACATGNAKSRVIPERLGFKLEGVLRESEFLNGRHVDQAIYSMLASEFAGAQQAREVGAHQHDQGYSAMAPPKPESYCSSGP